MTNRTRHAPRSRFERIMRERVLAAHAARPDDVEHITIRTWRNGLTVWRTRIGRVSRARWSQFRLE